MDEYLDKRAKSLRYNMTEEEKKLWFKYLKGLYPPFSCQKVIGKYIVDFYCEKLKLSIELDGSQHYYEQGLESDRERTEYLKRHDVHELRFPNNDVRDRFDGVCETIRTEIDSLKRKSLSPLFLSLLNKK